MTWISILKPQFKQYISSHFSRALGDQDDRENSSGVRGYENGRVYVAYQNEGVR